MYQLAKAQNVFFWSSKKKLTKFKVVPNYIAQNRVLDMANFEIHFLSNHNWVFLQTSIVMCYMSHTTTFAYSLLDFAHWCSWYGCLNGKVSNQYSVLFVTVSKSDNLIPKCRQPFPNWAALQRCITKCN